MVSADSLISFWLKCARARSEVIKMALLWCDGFDHYGNGATGKSNMLEGPWADVPGSVLDTITNVNPRTGSNHLVSKFDAQLANQFRRVLGGTKTTVGCGMALYFTNLPTSNDLARLIQYRDAANVGLVTFLLQTTGTIRVTYPGGSYTTPTPVMVAESYQHFETFVTFSGTVGYIEARVNGVTVLSLADVNTGAAGCAQVAMLFNTSGVTNVNMKAYMDDLYCYDGTGSFNNSFLGDRRVITLKPNANTAEADWTPVGAATGYEAIDDVTPDGDTTYISSATVGDISEFQYENMPAGISNIAAVVAVNMSRKTDAGPTNMQVSAISGASVTDGADRPITERYTYWQDVFETDPASAAPFTPAEVDALKIRFNRTL